MTQNPTDSGGSTDRVTQAYEKLRELIVLGKLAPGSRIIESDVAERLGVSRTPVRAALQRLRQEGYIVEPDSGKRSRASVAPLTKEDARELFYIVGEIEGLAAYWCADLDGDERGDLVEALDEINGALRDLSREARPDSVRMFELDDTFHKRYVAAGAGRRLQALHRATKPQAERYSRIYASFFTDEIQMSVDEHDDIIRAIEKGDPDEAQAYVEANWRNAAHRLSTVIEVVGERGSW